MMHPLWMVCGPIGCGKSTLAAEIAHQVGERVGGGHAIVVHQDSYFTLPFLPYRLRSDPSFEGPLHVDWGRLESDVDRLRREYTVVLEGHVVAARPELVERCGLIVVIECGKVLCRSRRLGRRKRAEGEEAELGLYFDEYVWPGFLSFLVPSLEDIGERCGEAGASYVRVLADEDQGPVRSVASYVLRQYSSSLFE